MFDYLDTKAYMEPDVVDMQDVEETVESVLDETEEEAGEIEQSEISEENDTMVQSEIPETPVETAEKSAGAIADQWEQGVFEYQGYHFEAVGVLSDGLEGKELVAQTRSNTELHLSTYHTEDFPKYSYDEFYAVSNAPDADIFRCLETGKNYIPGENELFGYEGEFQTYIRQEKTKIVTMPHNFRIEDNDLGAGGPKAKYKANIEAIRLLQTLEKEERLATPEEQEVLSHYVGWGGIPQAFEENNGSWANEYSELKNTLTSEEYSAARASTLNAFYTSPTVIHSMYEALENMGFTKGNILEPSCGVGNFMGFIPESMNKAKMYGVELDPVSGRIARQLYQKNQIAIQGFETTQFQDSFFDCVIGNVPFGAYQVNDKRYDRHHFLIHDYFIAKSLDLVRPGGVVAVVTSSGTMDKQNPAVRQYIANRAELLGAIRLPNNAFQRNANTNVVSDILFFQKRDRAAIEEPEWVNLKTTEEGYSVNAYYVEHPEMVLGEFTTESTQYGKQEVTVKPKEGITLEEQLKKAVQNIHGTITEMELSDSELEEQVVSIPADPDVKNFSFAVLDDDIYYRENSVMNKVELPMATTEEFKSWIFRDMHRRDALCQIYNERFNSIRPREYDGSHIQFEGMNPEITLMQHQKNAVAHILYGNNTLLAHCVGAGKTFQMIAAGMEAKRLGLSQKNLYVVPNHLTEQWGSDFLRLYPGANILVATKKDFEPANRKRFCSRIATGDYDAVIIGHTQFERIPLSRERQIAMLEQQIEDITFSIEEAGREAGQNYSVKQMEKTKKSLQAKLQRLNDQTRKDDVVTFEQLGVDRLFVDESHNFKNLFLYTKMRNVAGISQTDAQKSSDMFMKCRYMDELTGGRGIVFATGTPVSNSMTELYTIMRYLQYDTLMRMGMGHFDSWAATFGETVTAIELSPEGTGYRAKTRFARFFNLPELISIFKEAADIQTSDMLNLPVPDAEFINEVLKPSEEQQDMVAAFSERAESVRAGMINPTEDNMLKITNDGRKCALDQRLLNELLPDAEKSKVNTCVENAFQVWEEGKEQKTTQLIFCDLSTPKGDGTFNVYDDVRNKLTEKGIPKEEIAFIHEYNTEVKKAELFAKVRAGQVRILMGSTPKLGAGTNVQDRLIALHHLDCPWKPSDLEQQEGRILRQGNQNEKVKIFRYVTENTFDAYMWQILENKQKFISQIMTSKSPVRACEDVDDTALSYAEIKALATGNPYIKEKMDLDVQVSKLKLLKANHTSQIYRLESDIAKNYPVQISALKERIAGMQSDVSVVKNVDLQDNDSFSMNIGNVAYTDKKEAGEAMIAACAGLKAVTTGGKVGEYHGFTLSASYNLFANSFELTIKGKCSYKIEIGKDPLGNIQRIHNALSSIDKKLAESEQKLETVQQQLATAQEEVKKPFPKEMELNEKMERLSELNALLNMDEKGNETILADEDIGTEKIPDRDSSRKEEVRDTDRNLQETADKVHKPSILERLKQEKARQLAPEQTGTPKPKKNHEQEL